MKEITSQDFERLYARLLEYANRPSEYTFINVSMLHALINATLTAKNENEAKEIMRLFFRVIGEDFSKFELLLAGDGNLQTI